MLWPEVQFVAFGYQRLIEWSCKWAWTVSWRVRVPFWLVTTVVVIKVMTESLDSRLIKSRWRCRPFGLYIHIHARLFVLSITQFELIIRELGLCCSLVTRGCIVFLILPDNWAQLITVQGFDQWTNIHVQLTRNLRMIVTHVSFNEESTQLLGFARWDPSNVNFQSHIRWSHFEVNIWIIWMQ